MASKLPDRIPKLLSEGIGIQQVAEKFVALQVAAPKPRHWVRPQEAAFRLFPVLLELKASFETILLDVEREIHA